LFFAIIIAQSGAFGQINPQQNAFDQVYWVYPNTREVIRMTQLEQERERLIQEIAEKEILLSDMRRRFSKLLYSMFPHSEPVEALRDALRADTVNGLQSLASQLNIRGVSKWRKEALVERVAEELLKPEQVRRMLLKLDDEDMAFFERAVREGPVEQLADDYTKHLQIRYLGLMQIFVRGEALTFVVPTEIRAIYRQLCEEGFEESRAFFSLLDRTVRASVNLYGIVGITDVLRMFNQFGPKQATRADIDDLLDQRRSGGEYKRWQEDLIKPDLADDGYAAAWALLTARGDRPRYQPGKSELLLYAERDFLLQNRAGQALIRYLLRDNEEFDVDAEDVTYAVEEVYDRLQEGQSIREVLEFLVEEDLIADTLQSYNAIIPLIRDLYNNMRLWRNNGFTPHELHQADGGDRVLPSPAHKPGRNDPCPCGSGKKYKRCCGK